MFLAVGTPMRRGDGHADLSFVFPAVEELAPHLSGFTVIATKSTVPVGTSREIERRLKLLRPDADFAVCSNPEFLREGSAIQDFTHPDRVLVGSDEERAEALMDRLYKPLTLRNALVMFVGRKSAELAKYTANAFLAMKISFINEVADLCEAVGADVQEVATAIGTDRRIGNKFLHPGPGYGGSCFPKDVAALIRTAREESSPVSLIEQVQTRQFRAQDRHGPPHRARGGRLGRRQDGGSARRRLQAEHRRHARCTEPQSSFRCCRSGRDGARLRSAGRASTPSRCCLVSSGATSALEAAEAPTCSSVVTEWNEFRALDLDALKARMRATFSSISAMSTCRRRRAPRASLMPASGASPRFPSQDVWVDRLFASSWAKHSGVCI